MIWSALFANTTFTAKILFSSCRASQVRITNGCCIVVSTLEQLVLEICAYGVGGAARRGPTEAEPTQPGWISLRPFPEANISGLTCPSSSTILLGIECPSL